MRWEAVSSCSAMYQKANFVSKIFDDAKPILETIKGAHFRAKTQHKAGQVFKIEGILLLALEETDKRQAVLLVRREMAALSGCIKGVSEEDVHAALFKAAKGLLPSGI